MKSVEIILTQNNIKIRYRDFKKHIEKEFDIYELNSSTRALVYTYLFYDKLYRELDDLLDNILQYATMLDHVEDLQHFLGNIRDIKLSVYDMLAEDEAHKTLELTRKHVAHELDELEKQIAENISAMLEGVDA